MERFPANFLTWESNTQPELQLYVDRYPKKKLRLPAPARTSQNSGMKKFEMQFKIFWFVQFMDKLETS